MPTTLTALAALICKLPSLTTTYNGAQQMYNAAHPLMASNPSLSRNARGVMRRTKAGAHVQGFTTYSITPAQWLTHYVAYCLLTNKPVPPCIPAAQVKAGTTYYNTHLKPATPAKAAKGGSKASA